MCGVQIRENQLHDFLFLRNYVEIFHSTDFESLISVFDAFCFLQIGLRVLRYLSIKVLSSSTREELFAIKHFIVIMIKYL